ncbi:MAG TPA: TetR/AcrR family transcriptional regulator [Rhodanobacteraceae bacterium]|nr:TetR/AcrR family transcriptional regulator [Rhodanobacteraceae bacterium]
MRTSREEAARTRARIVRSAAALFKRDGIHATGLAGLMADAGLTHGGFYGHFESKEQLVAEACELAFAESLERIVEIAAAAPPSRRLRTFVEEYLSDSHRDNAKAGCGFAALGAELGRADVATREATTRAFENFAGTIATFLPDAAPAAKAEAARAIAATLVGALTIARSVSDDAVSGSVLESARKSALAQARTLAARTR